MKREADEDDSKPLSEALANLEEKFKQVRAEGKRPDQESAFISPNSESERLLNELSTSKRRPVDYNGYEVLGEEYFGDLEDFHGFWEWNTHICVRMLTYDECVTSRYCWDFNVPTISVQTCGLAASIRVQIREHISKPTPSAMNP
ncbi:hypothetical protein PGT21_012554 [Puccinia graminis f. sp. tritici]|uniref:Uncharacterized protein n=1 Tax=Puccinia graminis f. sp. tritici TaxID=56615 RepID=A0A5B0R0J8_PUCGR|nr:hypothetical protein PGT21_012554 [Puccinia graminis f. sp. tritici]